MIFFSFLVFEPSSYCLFLRLGKNILHPHCESGYAPIKKQFDNEDN